MKVLLVNGGPHPKGCTNLALEEVEKFTDRDRYFSATEAIEYGLADEIISKIEVKKMK